MKQNITSFNNRYAIILFIVYNLHTRLRDLNMDFTLGDCLFAAIKLTMNADPDKYGYGDCGIGFVNWVMGKNVIFDMDNSSPTFADNRRENGLDEMAQKMVWMIL